MKETFIAVFITFLSFLTYLYVGMIVTENKNELATIFFVVAIANGIYAIAKSMECRDKEKE